MSGWENLELFEPVGRSRTGDPPTSKAAARGISNRTEQRILAAFDHLPAYQIGFTDDELCARLPDVHGPTVKSARSRLSKYDRKKDRAPLLYDTGVRKPSDRGVDMAVWARKEAT